VLAVYEKSPPDGGLFVFLFDRRTFLAAVIPAKAGIQRR
jgi:hypothetical protein